MIVGPFSFHHWCSYQYCFYAPATPDWPAEELCCQPVCPSIRLSVTEPVNDVFKTNERTDVDANCMAWHNWSTGNGMKQSTSGSALSRSKVKVKVTRRG